MKALNLANRAERGQMLFRCVTTIVPFALAFFVMTIGCTIFWSTTVNERLYDCTDAAGLDYLQPGNWVHGRVAVVSRIVHGRSMSEPDTIKAGWSVARLWRMWFSFVGVSVAVSLAIVSVLRWLMPKPSGGLGVFPPRFPSTG